MTCPPQAPPPRAVLPTSTRLSRLFAEEARATGLPLAALLLAALLLHVGVTLAAVNPWHPDEHFQILEFAWARAGLSPLADLPWEFSARIRPTLQPTVALGVLAALRTVGIASPYPWILVLRLGTLALAFLIVLYVCARIARTLGRPGRRTLWLAALFLWFAPLLTGRFTSENWSGLALAAAIPLLEAEPARARDLGAGALLGLAFVVRFQIGFACAALVLWLVLQGSGGRARAARVIAGAVPVLVLAVLGDAWFYRAWMFTPWEYLRTNLIEGVASTFGIAPWYWYLAQAPLWMAPPLGPLVVALCAAGAAARPRSPWVWAFAAFVLGHSLIAHKELRFLFPMLYLVPVLAAFGVDWTARRAAGGAAARLRRVLGWTLAGQSAILAALLLTPSIHRGKEFDWHFYRFLWEAAEARPDTLYVLQRDGRPYRVWGLEGHVYRHPRVRAVAYAPGAALGRLVPAGTSPDAVLVVTRDAALPALAGAAGFDLVYAAEPGYRRMARSVGLEHAAALAWLRRVERWTDSEWVRRVYRVRAWTCPSSPR